jgi:hypothetical protein
MLHCFPIHQVRCENKAATRRAQRIISSSPLTQSGITFPQDANVKARQQNRENLKSLESGVVFLLCLPPFSMSHLLAPNPPSAHPPTTTSTTTTSRTTLHRSPALTFFTIAESSTRPLSHGCAQQPTKLKSPAHKQQSPLGAPCWYSGERRWQVCAVTYAGRMRVAACRLCAASGRI